MPIEFFVSGVRLAFSGGLTAGVSAWENGSSKVSVGDIEC
jgi:hypothetical protein